MATNILSGGFAAARTCLRRGETPPEPRPRSMLLVIPLFHVTASSAVMMGANATGSTPVFMRKWDPGKAMAIIEADNVTMTGGVPASAGQLHAQIGRGPGGEK